MFESAEMGHAIDKATYNRRVPKLREALLSAQLDVLETKKFPVLVLINGVEGAGKGETAHILSEWMDARHIITHGFGEHTDEERARPPMWQVVPRSAVRARPCASAEHRPIPKAVADRPDRVHA